MYIYIYDEYVNHKKYEHLLGQIETRITDLGLNGKIVRLGIMKSIQDSVSTEIRNGAKTIIAVGNDKTINQTVHSIINFQKSHNTKTEIFFGIIPVGEKNNLIAKALGIKEWKEACEILSGRRVETIDIGQANDNYFLAQAEICGQGTMLKINKHYSIEITEPGKIHIINLSLYPNNLPHNTKSSPQDGILELYIQTKKHSLIKFNSQINQSFFSFQKLTIFNKHTSLLVDNSINMPAPININVLKKRLNIIVGKKRKF
ncbi:hypothetical protein KKC56_00145 [Patescibacteria group bacterium]|nr:hypothetical protein [Patescibacteria group bacterium]MBU1160784.1 hypothetical protein [Patescibacteria group bacterium]MBU1683870.1 hypothetical protein [Patescibacteria group bacterium]